MSSMTINVIRTVFTSEVLADDNAAEPATVQERRMIGVNPGIQNGDTDPSPVQGRCDRYERRSLQARILRTRRGRDMSGYFDLPIKRNVSDFAVRSQRFNGVGGQTDHTSIEITEGTRCPRAIVEQQRIKLAARRVAVELNYDSYSIGAWPSPHTFGQIGRDFRKGCRPGLSSCATLIRETSAQVGQNQKNGEPNKVAATLHCHTSTPLIRAHPAP